LTDQVTASAVATLT